jgi:ribosome-binding protein aMBF1 (putative translation factor)
MGAALNPRAGRLLAPAICLALLTFTQRKIHVLRPSKSAQLRWAKPISNTAKTIGDMIIVQRKQMGLTQEQLAEMAGVHRQWLGRWERDRLVPSQSDLQKLRQVLKFFPATPC